MRGSPAASASFDQVVGVGVVEPPGEPVHDEAGEGACAGGEGDLAPVRVALDGDHHRRDGSVRVAQVVEHRQDDGEDDALLDAHGHHGHGGRERHDELVRTDLQDLAHAGEVDQLDADEEHHCGQHGIGHVLQRGGQEEQHDGDDDTGGELGDLAATAGPVHHLGLGGAAVDQEGAAQAGGHVGGAETDQVDVLGEAVGAPRCAGA